MEKYIGIGWAVLITIALVILAGTTRKRNAIPVNQLRQRTVMVVTNITHKVGEYKGEAVLDQTNYIGSGTIIGEHSIITAEHIINPKMAVIATPFGPVRIPFVIKKKNIWITLFNGKKMRVKSYKLLGGDLAILYVKQKLPVEKPVITDKWKIGEKVVMASIPYTDSGLIVKIGRIAGFAKGVILVDIAVLPGYSGSAIYTFRRGSLALLGIVSAKVYRNGQGDVAMVRKVKFK